MELVLDQMWTDPCVLLWPREGWVVVAYDPLNWGAIGDWFTDEIGEDLRTSLLGIASEIGGALITGFLLWRWLVKKP